MNNADWDQIGKQIVDRGIALGAEITQQFATEFERLSAQLATQAESLRAKAEARKAAAAEDEEPSSGRAT